MCVMSIGMVMMTVRCEVEIFIGVEVLGLRVMGTSSYEGIG